MKKQLFIILLATAACGLTACEKWLDVTSSSEIRAEDHYKTLSGFQQTLTGCYIGMTDQALYGQDMSWLIPELLGRQFYPYSTLVTSAGGMREYQLQNYNYGVSYAKTFINGTWAKAYNVIVNANEALYYIDKNADVLDKTSYNIIKGELLAIRAYVHFDLIRMFGYGNWAARKAEIDAKNAVPYVTTVSKTTTPQLTMDKFFEQLTNDLNEAARLLADEDPITGKRDWSYYEELNAEGFYNFRNLHLNYYAVRALQARVYLWEGSPESKELALKAAEEVISDFLTMDGKVGDYNRFRWMSSSDVLSYPAMALEQVFALNVANLQDHTVPFIVLNYADNNNCALYIIPQDVMSIYENSPSDWRAHINLLQQTASSATLSGYVSKKLIQASSATYYGNRVPMIRIPEMYYIAAECYATGKTPNLSLARERLTTVREKRGVFEPLDSAMDADDVMDEILKEYRKEFLFEGVVFYLYKRLGIQDIPNYAETMTDKEYVMPYPDFETSSGRVQ